MTRKQFIKQFSGFAKYAIRLNQERLVYGIQALGGGIENIDDEYFKQGLRFVVDEVDAAIIDEILSNMLSFEKNKYRRMYMTIAKRAALVIQEGISNRIFIHILLSLAGLTPKEQRKIEWELMDLMDEQSDEIIQADEKDIIAQYDFVSMREFAMITEDIQYATGGKKPQGVLLGSKSNRKIIITKDCPNPDRIIAIIGGEEKTTSSCLDPDDL